MTKPSPRAPATQSPEDVHRQLAEHFNRGDLDSLVGLYEPGATLVPQPGSSVTGERAVREALSGFLALKPHQTFVETLSVVLTEDCALTRSRWGLQGTNPQDGSPLTIEHFGVEIMRRQADGNWRFVVDDPFGGDAKK